MSQYQHIIWDWNGTIFNDRWLCLEIINSVLSKRQLPTLTEERYYEVFDFPLLDYYRRIGLDTEHESFEQVGLEFMDHYEARRTTCQLREGIADILTLWKKHGTQSILSAYKHDTLIGIVDHFKLTEHFLELVGHDDIYAGSKIDNGRKHLERLQIPPESVLLVGDTTHDHEVAHALGTDCILLEDGHHPRYKLEATGRPVFKSLTELTHYLQQRNG